MISLRSKITQKVLSYFFLHTKARLYLNEMVRVLELDRGNLVKKLRELEKEGILQYEFKGNQKYYFLNQNYPFLKEYQKIVLKTIGIEKQLKSAFLQLKGIKHVHIFGSYAQDRMDTESDIDVLVVGSCPHLDIERAITKLQKKIHREINVVDFDEAEYRERIKNKDPFIKDILNHKTIKII